MTRVRVTQVRSTIRTKPEHRGTMRALGLRRINSSTEREDTDSLRGMLHKVAFLVKVEEDATAEKKDA
jgi:large subunit ribosomal protein L30